MISSWLVYFILLYLIAELEPVLPQPRLFSRVQQIKKSGLAVEFAYQKPNALVKWAIKVFKASGKEIDQTTASMLINGADFKEKVLLI
jgi:hypothetical protein